LHRLGGSCVNLSMTRTRLLTLLVLATALPLGACYVDSGPPPPAYGYYGRPAPPSGYRTYEWHAYGHVNVEPRR
jgi:hypothetical protein